MGPSCAHASETFPRCSVHAIYCKLSFEFMYYIVYNFISCIYDLCFMTYIHATLYVLYLTIYVVYDLLYATLC